MSTNLPTNDTETASIVINNTQKTPIVTNFNGVFGDVFFVDPILNMDNSITMRGIENSTIVTFKSLQSLFVDMSPSWIASKPFVKMENPFWSESNETKTTSDLNKKILSMTMNPDNRNIILLVEKYNVVENESKASVSEKQWIEVDKDISYKLRLIPTTVSEYQEIEIVKSNGSVENYSVDETMVISKVRFCNATFQNHLILIVSNKKNEMYIANISDDAVEFTPLPIDIPFISWDFVKDTFIGLDTNGCLQIYSCSIDEIGMPNFQPFETMDLPIFTNMKNPMICFNPSTKCIAVWDAVLNGECGYFVFNGVENKWRWESLTTTPMGLFSYSKEVLYKASESDPLDTNDLWNSSIHFTYFGISTLSSQYKVFEIDG